MGRRAGRLTVRLRGDGCENCARCGNQDQVAYPQRAVPKVRKRKVAFWAGAGVMVLSGILILVSSFFPWMSGFFGVLSISGMDLVTNEQIRIDNLFVDYGDGYPIFGGLTSLILGLLVTLLAVVMLAARAKWPAGLALLFCLVSLGIAVTNLSSILRMPDDTGIMSAGSGLYVLILFSFLGVTSSIMALSG